MYLFTIFFLKPKKTPLKPINKTPEKPGKIPEKPGGWVKHEVGRVFTNPAARERIIYVLETNLSQCLWGFHGLCTGERFQMSALSILNEESEFH